MYNRKEGWIGAISTLLLLTLVVAVDIAHAKEKLPCGIGIPMSAHYNSSNRIYGGRSARPGELPFQVRLNIFMDGYYGRCSGVIIGKRYILTVAHCVAQCIKMGTAYVVAKEIHVVLGDWLISDPNDGGYHMGIEKVNNGTTCHGTILL